MMKYKNLRRSIEHYSEPKCYRRAIDAFDKSRNHSNLLEMIGE